MKKVSCVSRTAAAAAAALLLLSGCETPVPIWQPPLGSGETSGAGSQTVTPGTAPVTDLSTSDVKQPAPVVQAQSPDPTTSFSTEFDAAAAAPVPMQPGFVITGQGIDDGSPAILITLDARNKDSSILSRRLVLRIPEAMATRVGIETPSGVEPVSKWLEEAKSTMVSAPGAVGSGTDEIQLRVKSVAFPGDVPGIALDIGNMAEPGKRDFLIAIREVDAAFINVTEPSGGATLHQTLRQWIETHAGYEFRVPEAKPMPLIPEASETWQAYTSIDNLRRDGGIGEAKAKDLIPDLRITLFPEGLAGDGTLQAPDGKTYPVRRCSMTPGTAVPVCAVKPGALTATAEAAAPGDGREWIEVTGGAKVQGVGPILLKVGDRLLTSDEGRIFFWKKGTGDIAEVNSGASRFTGTARLDTTH